MNDLDQTSYSRLTPNSGRTFGVGVLYEGNVRCRTAVLIVMLMYCYCYVCSALRVLFHCDVLCTVCV